MQKLRYEEPLLTTRPEWGRGSESPGSYIYVQIVASGAPSIRDHRVRTVGKARGRAV
jgi:hypothetical protein